MKKAICPMLIIALVIFLAVPPSGEARGGGWWIPWAVIGGAAVLSATYHHYHQPNYVYAYPYPYPYYYYPYYAPPPVVVAPPGNVQSGTVPPPQPSSTRHFIYPRHGQNEKQQAEDQYQCHRWAVGQTGYDPTDLNPEARKSPDILYDYYRAMGACLDGRGYTMK